MPIQTGQQILAADVNEIGDHSFIAVGDTMSSLNISTLTTGTEGTGTSTVYYAGAIISTGGAAAGRGFLTGAIFGLGQASLTGMDWDKGLHLRCIVSRGAVSANCRGRIQFKDGTAEADLGAIGIGWVIKGYVLYAESYNTARQETATGITMVNVQRYVLDIVHDPGVDVRFYSDGVLVATHAVANTVPSGEDANAPDITISIDNQADNLDASILVGYDLSLWQESA